MYEIFVWEFWLGGMCQLLVIIFQVMVLFMLRYFIQFVQDVWFVDRVLDFLELNLVVGIGLVVGVMGMQVLLSFCINYFIYWGMVIGGMVRVSLISLIYEKSMVVSGRVKVGGVGLLDIFVVVVVKKQGGKDERCGKGGEDVGVNGEGWGNGRIINIMSVDMYRVDQVCGLFYMIWIVFLLCFIMFVLFFVNIIYSVLVGFVLLVVGMFIFIRVIRSLFRWRKDINKIIDQRVSLMQEIFQLV